MLGYLSRIGLGNNTSDDSTTSSQDSGTSSGKESSFDGNLEKGSYESANVSSEFDDGIDEKYNLKCEPPHINIEGDDVFSDYDLSDICSLYSHANDANDADVENDNDAPTDIQNPSQDICKKIVELIEFYLSDTNLAKDMFLLKHVSKHREGYVSVRLMTSYKKVKRITKDWNIVSQSLNTSKLLELNEEASKVRRRNPLPLHLDEQTRPFRTILATNISKDEAQMDHLVDLFGQYGEMFSLQLHRPGGWRILEEVKQMEVIRPGIADKVCVIVEYEHVYCARQALRTINNNTECNIEVIEIPRKKILKINHSNNNKSRSPHDNESAYFSASETDESIYNTNSPLRRNYRISSPSSVLSTPSASPVFPRKHFRDIQKNPNNTLSTFATSIRSLSISSSCASPEPFSLKLIPPGSNPLPRHRQIASLSSPPGSPYLGQRQLFNTNVKESNLSSAPTSPWLRRRNESNSLNTPDSSRCNSPRPVTPCQTPTSPSCFLWSPCASPNLRRRNAGSDVKADNVIRLPRGPDGTKGFHSCLAVQIGQA